MKFRIGTKISLLTCALVLAVSYTLVKWVYDACVDHVIDHEVVDLVDETNLSAQQMLRDADEMRQDLTELARAIARDPLAGLEAAAEAHGNPDEAFPDVRERFAALLKRQPDYLQVEIFRFKAGEDIDEKHPLARTRRAGIKRLGVPTDQREFLASLVADGRPFGQLSQFEQAQVAWHQPPAGDVPLDGPKMILQGGAIVPSNDDEPGGKARSGFVLLITSHFRLLDSDTSSEDQTAISPRHFLYVVTPRGEILQHPDQSQNYNLIKQEGQTLDREEPAVRDLFTELNKLMAVEDVSDEERTAKERGKTLRDQPIPSLRSWFGFTALLPHDGEIVNVLDPDLDDPDIDRKRKIRDAFKSDLNAYLHVHPEYTVSFPSRDIRRFKIRCQTVRPQDLAPLQEAIDKHLASAGLQEGLTWESPVELRKFAMHVLRLRYEPHHPERFLDLAVGVSYDEIASDVQAELQTIKLRAVAYSLAAGILAVFFSLIITRPLNKIITSTKRLAHGEYNLVLPVHEGGEIGELARSFKVMVEQIRDRNRALQEEQGKIRQLNADLTTERDSLEVRVRERTVQLQQTNSDLESARDAALEASRAKSAFLAQMSHELRTPLNAIIGYGELLAEEVADHSAVQFVPDLKKIIDAGRHLLGLINDILDLSKIEAGKMELCLETFEVRPLLESVVSTVDPLIRKNSNRLDWSCAADVNTLFADRTRVRQILLNLLSNSCKFTERGTIHLSAALDTNGADRHVVFQVRDTGVGMTPEQIDRLFQNFSQADASTTRKYGGTGLGLAICRRFCEMMGGQIAVSSEYGKGSAFTVRLPIVEPAPAGAPDESPQALETATGSHFAGTVVVIDDDQAARDLLRRHLSREGFQVLTAASGDEGLQLVREMQPAFVTLDVMMAGMDGWDVLTQLKADPQLAEIPVIMMTMVDDEHLGFALGAADFMIKPIDKERLLAVAQKYRNDAAASQSILVVEDDGPTRSLMARILHGAGWQVCEAANGRAALDKLPECRPSLILLDLMMPEMDGFAFMAEIRKLKEWRTTPVVIVTAKELSTQERARLNGGVQQILQKGNYSREQLLEHVRRLLQPAGATAGGQPA